MANPTTVSCPKNQWTKVATAVKNGGVWKRKNATYFQTFRQTGEAAPTLRTDEAKIFVGYDFISISSDTEIDVYIYCEINDGKVRVDI